MMRISVSIVRNNASQMTGEQHLHWKEHATLVLNLVKIIFQNKGKVKTVSDTQKVRIPRQACPTKHQGSPGGRRKSVGDRHLDPQSRTKSTLEVAAVW